MGKASVSDLASIYFPDESAIANPAEQAAKRELAAEVRSLVEQVLLIDVSRVTVSGLADASATVERARATIEELPGLDRDDRDSWPAQEHGQFERGPVSGRSKPLAPPMYIERHPNEIRATVVFNAGYEGAPDRVHGGVIAAAFDDLLGCAQLLAPTPGPTGTLTIRYRSPTPVGRPVELVAWVDRVEGRKVFCAGTARARGVLLAEADAVFIGSSDNASDRAAREE